MTVAHPPGQILVIEPAVRYPNLDSFNAMALRSPLPLAYHLPALYGLDSLDRTDPDLVRGVILLGSAASVNDGLPWQTPLGRWLRELWERRLPTLGLCFGHQLIAHLLGGRVGLAFGGSKRCAFRRVQLREAPAWASGPTEVEVPVSHREAVLECPEELRVFASSDEVSVEAFAHRELPIFGFQAHLEATPLWLEKHDLDPLLERRLQDARRLLGAFLDLVGSSSRERGVVGK
jgi:GMP synthase-like glutamine amidotransferase